MSARMEVCLAVTLLIATVGTAGAASLQPSVGATPNDPADGCGGTQFERRAV